MDLHYLKKIIRLVEQSEVDEIEIEEEGTKIRVAKNTIKNGMMMPIMHSSLPGASPAVHPAEQGASIPAETPSNLHEIRSPIVGTFYRAPAPDADPYVQIGQTIEKGAVVGIIEAMKLMNEIESDVSGKVVKILVENAKPVEYNQLLFIIEPM